MLNIAIRERSLQAVQGQGAEPFSSKIRWNVACADGIGRTALEESKEGGSIRDLDDFFRFYIRQEQVIGKGQVVVMPFKAKVRIVMELCPRDGFLVCQRMDIADVDVGRERRKGRKGQRFFGK